MDEKWHFFIFYSEKATLFLNKVKFVTTFVMFNAKKFSRYALWHFKDKKSDSFVELSNISIIIDTIDLFCKSNILK